MVNCTIEMPFLISVYGPTCTGKSDVAEHIAKEVDGILINADAFQVYKHFSIGTNKSELKDHYHLIDHIEPTSQYGMGEWIKSCIDILENAYIKDQNVVVVGGTGLYLRALNDEWQEIYPKASPELKEKIIEAYKQHGLEYLSRQVQSFQLNESDIKNPRRVMRALEKKALAPYKQSVQLPPFKKIKLSPLYAPEDLKGLIQARTSKLLEKGWIEECKKILDMGIPINAPAFQAIGYQDICAYLDGSFNLETLTHRISLHTIQYAKKQRTWLRTEKNLNKVNFHELATLKSRYLYEFLEELKECN